MTHRHNQDDHAAVSAENLAYVFGCVDGSYEATLFAHRCSDRKKRSGATKCKEHKCYHPENRADDKSNKASHLVRISLVIVSNESSRRLTSADAGPAGRGPLRGQRQALRRMSFRLSLRNKDNLIDSSGLVLLPRPDRVLPSPSAGLPTSVPSDGQTRRPSRVERRSRTGRPRLDLSLAHRRRPALCPIHARADRRAGACLGCDALHEPRLARMGPKPQAICESRLVKQTSLLDAADSDLHLLSATGRRTFAASSSMVFALF
jgi:hypothetical protein